jgi:adenylate kinase family enzyme
VSSEIPTSGTSGRYRRFAMVGISGSGKTTVGRAIAERLGLPYVEMDALVHGPSWVETPDDELRRAIEPVLAQPGWVIDSLYERKLGDVVLRSADTVVWLDLPLRVSLARLWRRTSDRIRNEVELWGGNRESWRTAFVGRESLFVWALRRFVYWRRHLPRRLREPALAHLELVRLRSPREVERWLSSLPRP